jgi:cytochrome c6
LKSWAFLAFAACGGGDADDTAGQEGDTAAGQAVFAEAGCGSCHTLDAAKTSGSAGPNLDEAQPSSETVVQVVTEGVGAMPSFRDQLSESEIRDVAAFVSSTAGS